MNPLLVKKCAYCNNLIKRSLNYCNKQCYIAVYKLKNKAKIAQQKATYHTENKAKIVASVNYWRLNNPGKPAKYNRVYKKKHKTGRKENMSVVERIKHLIRSRVHGALSGRSKSNSVLSTLGCSALELKAYIESRFHPHPVTGTSMNWSNLGRGDSTLEVWQVDHLIPLKSVDLTDPVLFAKVCHYTNLQPLWQIEHIKKTAIECGLKLGHIDDGDN